MFCEKCGNKLEDGAKFCTECGTKVEYNNQAPNVNAANNINTSNNVTSQNSANTSTQKINQNQNAPKKSSTTEKKIVIGIVIFLVVLFIAGLVVMNIIKNNVKKAVGNTLEELGQFVESVDNAVNEENELTEEANKEIETTLEWKTPFLKVDKEDSSVKSKFLDEEIEDLTNYEIYSAIISIEYDTSEFDYHLEPKNEINSEKFIVTIGSKRKITSEAEDTTTYYYSVYIAVKSDEKVEDVEIYIDEKKDKMLKGKENNIEAKKGEVKAELGDCLTFSANETRVYMVLTDIGEKCTTRSGTSSSYPGENYTIMSTEVGYIYITDKEVEGKGLLALWDINFGKIFKTSITDEKIVATDYENMLKNEEEVFVENDPIFLYRSGDGNFDIEYVYKEDSKTYEEAKKIFKNKNLKLKLLDKLDVEIIK